MDETKQLQQIIYHLKAQIGDMYVTIMDRNAMIAQLEAQVKELSPKEEEGLHAVPTLGPK